MIATVPGRSDVVDGVNSAAVSQAIAERSWWAADPAELPKAFATDLAAGLSETEPARRRQEFGRNVLDVRPPVSWIDILFRQFRSVIILLLVAALAVALFFGETLEAIAIAAVIVINSSIGFVTELRAERSMEALLRLGARTARVLRDSRIVIVAAEELVPGDVILLEAGDIVSADVRIVASSGLESDESVLTGESLPVAKGPDPVSLSAPIHERASMLFKGAAVSRGSARGIVTAIGQKTELGKIADLSRSARPEATPLERRLDRLGRRLVGLTVIIGVGIAIVGIASDKGVYLMVQTAVALAVATIPEGLPIVATIALAAGVRRMARRNVLINRLSSVETLGSTHVICTDKTGTLTENRMTVAEFVTAAGRIDAADLNVGPNEWSRSERDPAAALVVIAALCNDALSGAEGGGAEPMERALYRWLEEKGLSPDEIRNAVPRQSEEAFDPEIKMMATIHQEENGWLIAVKGAPEEVLGASDRVLESSGYRDLTEDLRKEWITHADRMGTSGQRVLGLARRVVEDASKVEPYEKLDFVGLVGMYDPPRQEVRKALSDCEAAGIRVVMVTGDQPGTAATVARSVGLGSGDLTVVLGSELGSLAAVASGGDSDLLDAQIFARVSPSQKLDLISLHQRAGHVVAMTGDGVNDAPALKKADIGVAMGVRGTEVAKEAADVVLLDDAFSSIVAAVRQGRIIFDNIRTFVVYLMSCNLSEVLVVGISTMVGGPLPILPLQILFLNLVTDVFPALALGVSPGRPDVLNEGPRSRDTPVLRRREWTLIAALGGVMTIAVLGSLFVALKVMDQSLEKAVTMSFLTLVFSQLANVFNMRSGGSGILRNEVTANRYVWLALLLCTAITLFVLEIPTVARTMSLSDPGILGWIVVLVGSAFTLFFGQALVSGFARIGLKENAEAKL